MAKNKPQIRFQGHQEEWEERQIQDVCNVNTGDKNTQDKNDRGKYPFYVRSQKVERIDSYTYDGEAILTAGDGDIGKVFHYANGKIGVHQRVYMLTDILCQSSYLYHYFSSHLFDRVSKMSAKNTVDSIRREMITEMPLSIPKDSLEQEKIGEFFRNLDELIEAKEQELGKLRQIKLALLDGMFPSDEPDKLNRGYNTLINNVLQMDNQLYISTSELNVPVIRFRGFTEPWKKVSLSENATFSKGRGYSKADIKKTGTPILLYGSLYTNYNTSIEYVVSYADKKDGSIFSIGNEVVVPASGETAEDIARASAIYAKGIILGGDLNIIYPNEDIDPTFLALDITYGRNHKLLVKKAQGTSVVHLHNTDIQELDLVMPDKNEQKKIGDFFSEQDENIRSAQLQINKLRNIKQACMQKMFA